MKQKERKSLLPFLHLLFPAQNSPSAQTSLHFVFLLGLTQVLSPVLGDSVQTNLVFLLKQSMFEMQGSEDKKGFTRVII